MAKKGLKKKTAELVDPDFILKSPDVEILEVKFYILRVWSDFISHGSSCRIIVIATRQGIKRSSRHRAGELSTGADVHPAGAKALGPSIATAGLHRCSAPKFVVIAVC
jgi:hypothetical protein